MIEAASLGLLYKWPLKLTSGAGGPVSSTGRWVFIKTASGKPAILRVVRWHNITDTTLSFYDIALVELSADGTWDNSITGVPVFPGAPASSLTVKVKESSGATEVSNSDRGRHGAANSREWTLRDGLYLKPSTSYALATRTAAASHDAVVELETDEPFA